nr:hypothetical protein [Tanacetum cinerariifolium]
MLTLKFADTHNMVSFLSKPTKSDGIEQIVESLNAHPIRYALTINPTIYISCIEQFWSTSMAKTINGEVQLHAQVDGKEIFITESSVRRDLQLADVEGIDCLPSSTIFEQLTLIGPNTTAWNEFSSNMASAIICLATNQKFNFSKLIFDSMIRNLDNVSDEAVHKELGDSLVRATTTASSLEAEQDSGGGPRVLDLEKTKTTQFNEIVSLKRRVKKLKKRNRSRTHKLKRLYKVGLSARIESSGDEESLGEDASKQGRRIDAIDADEDITLVNDADNEMFDVDDLGATTVTITTEKITLAQALKALKTSKPKVKGIVFQEPGKSTTTTISSQQSQDKGKGIMIEEPVKPKKKDQIKLDEEAASLLKKKDLQVKKLRKKKEPILP